MSSNSFEMLFKKPSVIRTLPNKDVSSTGTNRATATHPTYDPTLTCTRNKRLELGNPLLRDRGVLYPSIVDKFNLTLYKAYANIKE